MGGESEAFEVSSMPNRVCKCCYCDEKAYLRTLWIEENPSQRFYGYVKGKSGCNFFAWYNKEVKEHEKNFIKKLMRKVDVLEYKQKLYVIGLCFTTLKAIMLMFLLLKISR